MDQKVEEYKNYLAYVQKRKIDSKVRLMQQVKANITDSKEHKQKMIDLDKSTNHLINPVEYQMMEERMENRKKEQRVKKTTDDEKNKHTTFLHKLQLLQLRKQENKKKIEEPFYDRLRREDNERDEMVKQSNINRRAQMSKNAAYNDKGQCLLNITTMLENQQNDETKAKAI